MVQSDQNCFRRHASAVVLANDSSRKTRNKNRVDGRLPMFKLLSADVRPKGPRHFDCQSNALEPGAKGLVDQVTDLFKLLSAIQSPRLAPVSLRPEFETPPFGFLSHVNP